MACVSQRRPWRARSSGTGTPDTPSSWAETSTTIRSRRRRTSSTTGLRAGAQGEFKEVDSPCGNEIKQGFATDYAPWWSTYTYCRSGEATLNGAGKFDALYVPTTMEVKWADATSASHSDHVPLWAGVMF
ncbi:hypothetical protein NKH18_02725 [Streptomyces sp. M10(2022)]